MKTRSLILGGISIAVLALAYLWATQFGNKPTYETLTKAQAAKRAKDLSRAFEKYGDQVKITWDQQFLYVESNGLPQHEMMKGITNWNQQVPLPKAYKGSNSFKIPLQPIPNAAFQPTTSYGPIAVASNGVPIFNPTTGNGKDDPKELGELDEFGGHAGKGDDYHYHTAPLFLNDGDPSRPIGYSLEFDKLFI